MTTPTPALDGGDKLPSAVPIFWPVALAAELFNQGQALYARNLHFVEEELKIHARAQPKLATPGHERMRLRSLSLREYGEIGKHGHHDKPAKVAKAGVPTLVVAPYAGHSSAIADYLPGQSLVQVLLENGLGHVALTDWHSATEDMKDLEIDNYLADLCVVIDELGGRVNLVGLCQGGWISTMIAARFPEKVNALVLAGAPIDTDAGDGPLKKMVHSVPQSFYADLVRVGGGLMRGSMMLRGWKNMHPDEHYFNEHVDLYQHIDDPAYVSKRETFAAWYENPIDLPGRWYLEAIDKIFKHNQLARDHYVALGKKLHLKDITCPLYLLGGKEDDITTPEQVLNAANLVGTPASKIQSQVVPGGHIGLFMGSRTLRDYWPGIAAWIVAQA